MPTKYQGDVEFTDSDGTPYVLRLSTFQYVSIQAQAEKLDGRAWQLFILHQALINGAEAQKKLTREQAGDLLDDIGYLKADELISATRFGVNSKQAADDLKKKHEAAVKDASKAFAAKVSALKAGVTDEVLLEAIDRVAAKVLDAIGPDEGSANPPPAETPPSS
jgi:hypothetical protein